MTHGNDFMTADFVILSNLAVYLRIYARICRMTTRIARVVIQFFFFFFFFPFKNNFFGKNLIKNNVNDVASFLDFILQAPVQEKKREERYLTH